MHIKKGKRESGTLTSLDPRKSNVANFNVENEEPHERVSANANLGQHPEAGPKL
jgi:hypothetical protein